MIRLTFIIGFLSILLGGVLAFLAVQHGSKPATALIPAYVGLLFVGLGLLATREGARKHVMHALAALSLLLTLSGLGMAVPKMVRYYFGEWPADAVARPLAWWGQLILAGLMAVFLVAAIRSFKAARAARQLAGGVA
jgi:glucose uptake protein GlcU